MLLLGSAVLLLALTDTGCISKNTPRVYVHSKHERSRKKVLPGIEVVGSKTAGSSAGRRELGAVQGPAAVVENTLKYCTAVAHSSAGLTGFGRDSVAVARNRRPIAVDRLTSRNRAVAADRHSKVVVQP